MNSILKKSYGEFLKRSKVYQSFGYDIIDERDGIITAAEPIKDKILEVGTGKGYFTIAIAIRGYCLSTLDISKEEQEFAKSNLSSLCLKSKVRFYAADACSLPFKDKSFSTVFCINSFHHFEDCFDVLGEFLRVCDSKGKIVISDFSQKGLAVVADIHKKEGRVHKPFKVYWKRMEKFLQRAGFVTKFVNTKYQKTLIASGLRKGIV